MTKKESAGYRALCLMIAWTMLLPGALSILMSTAAAPGPAPGPLGIDIVVDGISVEIASYSANKWENGVGIYDVDGNIIVRNNGILTLRDVSINFLQDTNHRYRLTVDNGSRLIMRNATITVDVAATGTYLPFAMYLNDSTLIMEDHSVLAFPGALEAINTTLCINDSWITGLDPRNAFPNPGDDFDRWYSNFYTPIPKDISAYLSSLPTDADRDRLNDGPKLYFEDCTNITIADSRIDMLYEDEYYSPTLGVSTPVYPATWGSGHEGVGPIGALQTNDTSYVTVTSEDVSPGNSNLSIDTFDVSSLISGWPISAVVLEVIYISTENGISGYNRTAPPGTTWLNYSLEGGAMVSAIEVMNNVNETKRTNDITGAISSISDIANLNITFENIDDDADSSDNVDFDMIRIVVTQVPPYIWTDLNLYNSEMSVINSYVSVDFLSAATKVGRKNSFNLNASSHLYMYNMTIDLDDDANKVNDFEDYAMHPEAPFVFADALSEAYLYRWMEVPVIDALDNPVKNATVNATYDHPVPNDPSITYVFNLNDLSNGTTIENLSADARILAYLDRKEKRVVNGTTYRTTDDFGRTLLPLISDVINIAELPEGNFTGNYKFNASCWNGTAWHYKTVQRSFVRFPDMTWEMNSDELVDDAGVPLLRLDNLYLDRPDLVPTSITFNPPTPSQGDAFWVIVTVENTKDTAARAFDVKVVDYAVGVKISEHIWQVEYLKGQSTTTLSWSWTADPGGGHSFEVFVDSG
ncbi:MAG: CARDB domain-containing protein, partial [Candidatus Thermoplasmatota archaeon]